MNGTTNKVNSNEMIDSLQVQWAMNGTTNKVNSNEVIDSLQV